MRTERIEVGAGAVRLRPLARGDRDAWRRLRLRDEAILRPVEPTMPDPWARSHTRADFRRQLRGARRGLRDGTSFIGVIEVDGRFAGQLTLVDVRPFPLLTCAAGYWVDSELVGRGVATAALALGVDHAAALGLHRVTATVLPENTASRRVLAHCGFAEEGVMAGAMHMDGRWRDHILAARLVGEDHPSAVDDLIVAGRARRLEEDPDAPDDSCVYGEA
ncbi:GNAT family N-acetyltransferase [Corynebacterium sp. 335C]